VAAGKREAFEAGAVRVSNRRGPQSAPVFERMNASIAEWWPCGPICAGARRRMRWSSLQIARRVLHRELSVDGNALNASGAGRLRPAGAAESWQFTVHPQFADAIRGSLPAASGQSPDRGRSLLCAGHVLVARSAEGVIDASVDSQLSEISRGLTDRLTRK
jgi:flagellar biosynthesis/type III secretory pathway protein FliH